MIKANDPALRSWVDVPENSDFPIQNLPFGVGVFAGEQASPVVAIGDHALRLLPLAQAGLLDDVDLNVELYDQPILNPLMIAAGKKGMRRLRNRLSELLAEDNSELRSSEKLRARSLVPRSEVQMVLPVHVGDYTDFYSSEQHATNVGTMFRDPDNALLPNWKHLPVGYHGRASSIVVSGVPLHRPKGQTKADDADAPTFGPTRLLDFELEMAFVTFQGKPLGESISTAEAEDFIFGLLLFNDWSARDIQKWEYVPLGPFLAKNFGSSVSPWIVTLDALEPFRISGPDQYPEVLPYLEQDGASHIDLPLEVLLDTGDGQPHSICHSNFKNMYWSMAQQLAHHTVNGCDINAGDMMASGTISGDDRDSYGSMLELSWRGSRPVELPNGEVRKFIADGDTVIMRGATEKDGVRIGFGEVRGTILPAI